MLFGDIMLESAGTIRPHLAPKRICGVKYIFVWWIVFVVMDDDCQELS